jgi:hypothetical protein
MYSKVTAHDLDLSRSDGHQHKQISGNSSVPIHKPPSQRRDAIYSVGFCLVFVLLIVFTAVIKREPYSKSLILAKFAGNWASMIMIAPLFGSFVGASIYLVMVTFPSFRDTMFSSSLEISIVLKICVGNVFLLTSDFWIVGLFVFFSIIVDSMRFFQAKENLSASTSLIEMIESINEPFDSMLLLVCFVIVIVHMFVLLWWGVVFVYVISEVSKVQGIAVMLILMVCLYWIVQFFHSLLGSIVGGTYLWVFIREKNSIYRREEHINQIFLYIRCALTACMGSLCKAALFVPPAQGILTTIIVLEWRLRSFGHQSRVLRTLLPPLLSLLHLFEPTARHFHRLTHVYIAVYGHTFHKASDGVNSRHPDTIDMMSLDSTSFLLKMVGSNAAIVVSAFLVGVASIEADNLERVWPLFFLECYVLTYACISLSLHGLRAASDALILASAEAPDEFSSLNPILYHRFSRITEIDMT